MKNFIGPNKTNVLIKKSQINMSLRDGINSFSSFTLPQNKSVKLKSSRFLAKACLSERLYYTKRDTTLCPHVPSGRVRWNTLEGTNELGRAKFKLPFKSHVRPWILIYFLNQEIKDQLQKSCRLNLSNFEIIEKITKVGLFAEFNILYFMIHKLFLFSPKFRSFKKPLNLALPSLEGTTKRKFKLGRAKLIFKLSKAKLGKKLNIKIPSLKTNFEKAKFIGSNVSMRDIQSAKPSLKRIKSNTIRQIPLTIKNKCYNNSFLTIDLFKLWFFYFFYQKNRALLNQYTSDLIYNSQKQLRKEQEFICLQNEKSYKLGKAKFSPSLNRKNSFFSFQLRFAKFPSFAKHNQEYFQFYFYEILSTLCPHVHTGHVNLSKPSLEETKLGFDKLTCRFGTKNLVNIQKNLKFKFLIKNLFYKAYFFKFAKHYFKSSSYFSNLREANQFLSAKRVNNSTKIGKAKFISPFHSSFMSPSDMGTKKGRKSRESVFKRNDSLNFYNRIGLNTSKKNFSDLFAVRRISRHFSFEPKYILYFFGQTKSLDLSKYLCPHVPSGRVRWNTLEGTYKLGKAKFEGKLKNNKKNTFSYSKIIKLGKGKFICPEVTNFAKPSLQKFTKTTFCYQSDKFSKINILRELDVNFFQFFLLCREATYKLGKAKLSITKSIKQSLTQSKNDFLLKNVKGSLIFKDYLMRKKIFSLNHELKNNYLALRVPVFIKTKNLNSFLCPYQTWQSQVYMSQSPEGTLGLSNLALPSLEGTYKLSKAKFKLKIPFSKKTKMLIKNYLFFSDNFAFFLKTYSDRLKVLSCSLQLFNKCNHKFVQLKKKKIQFFFKFYNVFVQKVHINLASQVQKQIQLIKKLWTYQSLQNSLLNFIFYNKVSLQAKKIFLVSGAFSLNKRDLLKKNWYLLSLAKPSLYVPSGQSPLDTYQLGFAMFKLNGQKLNFFEFSAAVTTLKWKFLKQQVLTIFKIIENLAKLSLNFGEIYWKFDSNSKVNLLSLALPSLYVPSGQSPKGPYKLGKAKFKIAIKTKRLKDSYLSKLGFGKFTRPEGTWFGSFLRLFLIENLFSRLSRNLFSFLKIETLILDQNVVAKLFLGKLKKASRHLNFSKPSLDNNNLDILFTHKFIQNKSQETFFQKFINSFIFLILRIHRYEFQNESNFFYFSKGPAFLLFLKNPSFFDKYKKNLLTLLSKVDPSNIRITKIKLFTTSSNVIKSNSKVSLPIFLFDGFYIFQKFHPTAFADLNSSEDSFFRNLFNKFAFNSNLGFAKFICPFGTKNWKNSKSFIKRKPQNFKLLILPSTNNLKHHLNQMKKLILKSQGKSQLFLIEILSPIINKWSYYYNFHFLTLKNLDFLIMEKLWKWSLKRHNKLSNHWIREKYYFSINNKRLLFSMKFDSRSLKLIKSNFKRRSSLQFYKIKWVFKVLPKYF